MVRIFGNCSMNLFLKFSFSSLFTINVSHYTHNMGTWNLYNLAVFGTQICVGNNGEENMSGRELKNNFFKRLVFFGNQLINSTLYYSILFLLFFPSGNSYHLFPTKIRITNTSFIYNWWWKFITGSLGVLSSFKVLDTTEAKKTIKCDKNVRKRKKSTIKQEHKKIYVD